MKLGKTLWLIVLIKIAVIILIFKMLFFNETINTKFDSKNEKINFVYENLIKDVK
ncbi:membrane protein [Campylobacter hominis]|nr:membrane protein [Campylobacter hominis]